MSSVLWYLELRVTFLCLVSPFQILPRGKTFTPTPIPAKTVLRRIQIGWAHPRLLSVSRIMVMVMAPIIEKVDKSGWISRLPSSSLTSSYSISTAVIHRTYCRLSIFPSYVCLSDSICFSDTILTKKASTLCYLFTRLIMAENLT